MWYGRRWRGRGQGETDAHEAHLGMAFGRQELGRHLHFSGRGMDSAALQWIMYSFLHPSGRHGLQVETVRSNNNPSPAPTPATTPHHSPAATARTIFSHHTCQPDKTFKTGKTWT